VEIPTALKPKASLGLGIEANDGMPLDRLAPVIRQSLILNPGLPLRLKPNATDTEAGISPIAGQNHMSSANHTHSSYRYQFSCTAGQPANYLYGQLGARITRPRFP